MATECMAAVSVALEWQAKSVNGQGVWAYTPDGSEAVYGEAVTGIGVHGYSGESDAVVGEALAEAINANGGSFTAAASGSGVLGTSKFGTGGPLSPKALGTAFTARPQTTTTAVSMARTPAAEEGCGATASRYRRHWRQPVRHRRNLRQPRER